MEKQPEQSIELIPMEAAFKLGLEGKYRKPFRNNVTIMTIAFLLLYLFILAACSATAINGLIKTSSRSGQVSMVKVAVFDTGLTIVAVLLYLHLFAKFARMNIHYLKDADFGFVVKERMVISKVFPTPAGIHIYWLDSPAIKTFTPDPYRHFREGDSVAIYYLKHSKEYLAYEV